MAKMSMNLLIQFRIRVGILLFYAHAWILCHNYKKLNFYRGSRFDSCEQEEYINILK